MNYQPHILSQIKPKPLSEWENLFEKKISEVATTDDPAHDLLHFKRVVNIAKQLCQEEKANLHIVVPAAWLHDFVVVSKNNPLRKQASRLSAEKAATYLHTIGYDEKYIAAIAHAIEAHSFSANIEAQSIEAQIVQDADRLDGLGAIGIARCFATAGLLKTSFYSTDDPFCNHRKADDSMYTLDHFYKKLFKVVELLKTESGRKEGLRRAEIMKRYLSDLSLEINL